jgi:Fic family protein
MTWNWQQPDWPNFSYDANALAHLESTLQHKSGIMFGALKHLNADEKDALTIEFISSEALNTSEIEGEHLDRDSVQSSLRKFFGLRTEDKNIPYAEQGIAQMMFDLYQTFDEALTHQTLFRWHDALAMGRDNLTDKGRYRTHKEDMLVVSGRYDKPKIHFKAPPSSRMKVEMNRFIKWFNQSAVNEKTLSPLIRAGIAHLYFVCIHPFEDGNGRIGRALSEKALAQCLGQPTLIALSYTIQKQKRSYYDALEQANKTNEITQWLIYFAETILDALDQTQIGVEFLIEKTRLYDQLRGKLNARQEKVLKRLFAAGHNGFQGGLSAENYISITKTSRATATRDLVDLLDKGALIKTGQLKHTRYYLNILER